ncbi:suppressor of fused homolog [Paramacrobiotus metropolitanus]|uniref:suppressor of fused homolog n=1 Tax=Paramacrobiotus metropolitanus TaxID=2943436 RepID=UPI002445F90D|nr:suppressor of fused homolog [Paramacrobiotus metropolitanus]
MSNSRQEKAAVSMPPGLSAIHTVCQRLYPSQTNPIQMTSKIKYWLGGPDPLDFITIYLNAGTPAKNTPEHWHYITCGLSDLYGDGRIHPIPDTMGLDAPSGLGMEMTFRLKRKAGQLAPPAWPGELLQGLARYLYASGNSFVAGDHIAWNKSLDKAEPDSVVQHILVAEDPQLRSIGSELGRVVFMQLVGVCQEELEAAQHWNGRGVLELMRSTVSGPLWVTDMQRTSSPLATDSRMIQSVRDGITKDGSDLSGVSCRCRWKEVSHIRPTRRPAPPASPLHISTSEHDTVQMSHLASAHLTLDFEAGSLLLLALGGRLLHSRHFTFQSVLTDHAITLVSEGVNGTLAQEATPFVSIGPWLQVFLDGEAIREIADDITQCSDASGKFTVARVFAWPRIKLSLTVSDEQSLFL